MSAAGRFRPEIANGAAIVGPLNGAIGDLVFLERCDVGGNVEHDPMHKRARAGGIGIFDDEHLRFCVERRSRPSERGRDVAAIVAVLIGHGLVVGEGGRSELHALSGGG